MNETKTQTLKSVNCSFCGVLVVYANCDKLVFKTNDFHTEILFKRAQFIEVRCGKCRETTVIRNPKTWRGKKV